jgi:hypothetical protein
MRVELGLGKNWKHIFFAIEKKKETRSKNREARGNKRETCLPTGRQETRTKKQEARSERQEPRAESQEACQPTGRREIELFAVRFLCDSAPLRAKRKKNQETRAEKQETRSERPVCRGGQAGKNQED